MIRVVNGESMEAHIKLPPDYMSELQRHVNNIVIDILGEHLTDSGKDGIIFLLSLVNELLPSEAQYMKGIDFEA